MAQEGRHGHLERSGSMWAIACGTLLAGYTFWGVFTTEIEAMEYAKRAEGECFLVRIHMVIQEEEPKA